MNATKLQRVEVPYTGSLLGALAAYWREPLDAITVRLQLALPNSTLGADVLEVRRHGDPVGYVPLDGISYELDIDPEGEYRPRWTGAVILHEVVQHGGERREAEDDAEGTCNSVGCTARATHASPVGAVPRWELCAVCASRTEDVTDELVRGYGDDVPLPQCAHEGCTDPATEEYCGIGVCAEHVVGLAEELGGLNQ